jgi:hypothetical protein
MTSDLRPQQAPSPAPVQALALTLGGISTTIAAILISLVALGFGQLEQKIGARLRGIFEMAGILSLIASANCVDDVADNLSTNPTQKQEAMETIDPIPQWIDCLFSMLKLPEFGNRVRMFGGGYVVFCLAIVALVYGFIILRFSPDVIAFYRLHFARFYVECVRQGIAIYWVAVLFRKMFTLDNPHLFYNLLAPSLLTIATFAGYWFFK